MNHSLFFVIWCLHTFLEVLPISSSGHITLFLSFLKSKVSITKTIDYFMHITSALIVGLFLLKNYCYFPLTIYNIALIFIADCITYSCLKLLRPRFHISLFAGFLITACLLLTTNFFDYGQRTTLTFYDALILGFVQGCALLPGVSRMGSTFACGCFLGLEPKVAFVFSMAMQFPLMLAAIAQAILLLIKDNTMPKISFLGSIFITLSTFLSLQLLFYVFCLLTDNYGFLFGFYMLLPCIIAWYKEL